MIICLDYSCRNFYLLSVDAVRLSDTDFDSNYFSKMLGSIAVTALEHFYLSIRVPDLEIKTREIYCFSEEEVKEIRQCLDSSIDVLSYELINITSVILYGTDDYISLYDKINIEVDEPNVYIVNNFLKIHATPQTVKQKVDNVGLNYLFPVEKEIYLNANHTPIILSLKSDELLPGIFNPRIYYFTIHFNDKLVWEKISKLLQSAIINTSFYLGLDYESRYVDICDETENAEVGVCVTLPTNIRIFEAAFSFIDIGYFKYEIVDITDNVLYHHDVPDIYLKKFNLDDEFYAAVNQVIEDEVDVNSIIQKISNNGISYLLPCEKELVDSIQ